jgi:hypothetical protein
VQQRAGDAGADVLRGAERRDALEVVFEARQHQLAVGRAEAGLDVVGKHERLVRADLDPQVAAVAAAALAFGLHRLAGDDAGLQLGQAPVHAHGLGSRRRRVARLARTRSGTFLFERGLQGWETAPVSAFTCALSWRWRSCAAAGNAATRRAISCWQPPVWAPAGRLAMPDHVDMLRRAQSSISCIFCVSSTSILSSECRR